MRNSGGREEERGKVRQSEEELKDNAGRRARGRKEEDDRVIMHVEVAIAQCYPQESYAPASMMQRMACVGAVSAQACTCVFPE